MQRRLSVSHPAEKPFSTLDKQLHSLLTSLQQPKLWAAILCSFQCTLHDPQLGIHTHWRGSLYPASKAKIERIISLNTNFFFLLEPQCVVTGTMTHGWIQQVPKPLPFPPMLLHLWPKAAQSWSRAPPVLSPDDSFLPLMGYSSYSLLN